MVRGGALMEGGGNKRTCYFLCYSTSVCRPPAGASGNIRAIQDLLGQSNEQAAVIYAYGPIRGLYGVASLGVSL
jgi:hypothetical protein